MTHTPEPWRTSNAWTRQRNLYIGSEGSGFVPIGTPFREDAADVNATFADTAEANAARIVACVNACAGMADPEGEVARLRAVEEAAVDVLLDAERMDGLLLKLTGTPHECDRGSFVRLRAALATEA